MREVSELDHRWLLEIAPHFYEVNIYIIIRIIDLKLQNKSIKKK